MLSCNNNQTTAFQTDDELLLSLLAQTPKQNVVGNIHHCVFLKDSTIVLIGMLKVQCVGLGNI